MKDFQKLINQSFPIASQTSNEDKLFLLKAINFVKTKVSRFKYLEIGSFMGGSLTPFLMEECCELVVSVDERGRQQPDERGAKFDYSGVTHQTMIDALLSHGVNIEKLITHDGSINTYKPEKNKFDLALIDGEHTDIACVRDFVWTYPMMKKDSVILFHDSTIIYKALSIIREIMSEKNTAFKIYKHQSSEISALFQGEFAKIDFESLFGFSEDWSTFQTRSETAMLQEVLKNRLDLRVSPKIKPVPLYKAY